MMFCWVRVEESERSSANISYLCWQNASYQDNDIFRIIGHTFQILVTISKKIEKKSWNSFWGHNGGKVAISVFLTSKTYITFEIPW